MFGINSEIELPKLKIILMDDGSIDGSGDICDDFAAIDERIKVIY